MIRLLLHGIGVVCLMLTVAAVVLWLRSYRVADGFVWKPGPQPDYYRLYVGCGGVRIGWGQYSFELEPYLEYYPDRTPTYPTMTLPSGIAGRLGFNAHCGTDSKGKPSADVVFPIWALILLALPVTAQRAAVLYSQRRSRRRTILGLCLNCGYDLRASPGCCPECGMGSPAKAAGDVTPPTSTPSPR
jgi:hypothetical protein